MSAAVLSLLLADSRTPAGGYAHSAGLEPAIAAGLGADEVPAFLAARLETIASVDAAFAAAACAASTARSSEECRSAHPMHGQGDGPRKEEGRSVSDIRTQTCSPRNQRGSAGDVDARPGLGALLALDDELAARTPSAPQRAAARQLGRALLRVGARLWPRDRTLEIYARESEWTPRPVAFGVVARAAGLSPREAARLALYEDAAGVASAAVKLLPLDAADATAWVAGLAEQIEQLAHAAADAAAHAPNRPGTAHPAAPFAHAADHTPNRPGAALPAAPSTLPAAPSARPAAPSTLPATSTPLLDLRALDHHRSERKLFVT